MAWFRSVATMETASGNAVTMARVATPVPAAISRTRPRGRDASRAARSAAYGSKSSGTRYVSYSSAMEPVKTLSEPWVLMRSSQDRAHGSRDQPSFRLHEVADQPPNLPVPHVEYIAED